MAGRTGKELPAFQLVLSDPKTRKAVKLEVKDPKSSFLLGLKVGDVVDASPLGINCKFQVTGGSDRAGFPMRADVKGTGKKRAILTYGVGFRPADRSVRKRKLVRGNTITEEIYQVNAKLVEGELPASAPAEGGSPEGKGKDKK